MDPKFKQPDAPPPKMFVGQKEHDFVKQINQEVLSRVIGQLIIYYPISLETTEFNFYGEAINKTPSSPIRIYALVDYKGMSTSTTTYGLDRRSSITVHFFKRRLVEDQELYVREGDFILYGEVMYEIMKLSEPKDTLGDINYKIEISAECVKSRENVYDGK